MQPSSQITGSSRGDVVTKPQDHLRNKPKFLDLIEHGRGFLTDRSGKHKVQLDWKLNEMAIRDGVFKLTVDDKEVYIDIDELMFYTRVMFTK